MCQVRLIIVFDNLYQVLHVYRLLISVPDHTFQFQHVHRLRITQYCDVPSMLNKRSSPYVPISRCLQARERKNIKMCQVQLISVSNHTFEFQHLQRKKVWRYAKYD